MVYTPRAIGVITDAIPRGSCPTQSNSGSVIVSTNLWLSDDSAIYTCKAEETK
ncbi:hypothetical protein A2U01_0091828 [Trifolium medium]|uniref:Uncharacterized protein n=1 Tax=Trifolium medium TaxID=97028 RepID=A0A392UFQ1_9FABA|nr:hypothetical protein [Trifolium medium]